MLTEFNCLYNKIMGHVLSPSKYGFYTLLELMNKQVDTVNLQQAEMGDWLITLAGTPYRKPNISNNGMYYKSNVSSKSMYDKYGVSSKVRG